MSRGGESYWVWCCVYGERARERERERERERRKTGKYHTSSDIPGIWCMFTFDLFSSPTFGIYTILNPCTCFVFVIDSTDMYGNKSFCIHCTGLDKCIILY